jgi:hypothetical protein
MPTVPEPRVGTFAAPKPVVFWRPVRVAVVRGTRLAVEVRAEVGGKR